MDSIMKIVNDFVGGLSSIFIGLLGLGILSGLLFGNQFFIGDVIGNITALVSGLGESGLVGLIVAIIVLHLLGVKAK
jgi:hypothetical protein